MPAGGVVGVAVPGGGVVGVAVPGYPVLGGLDINLPLYRYILYFSFALAETKAAANSNRRT